MSFKNILLQHHLASLQAAGATQQLAQPIVRVDAQPDQPIFLFTTDESDTVILEDHSQNRLPGTFEECLSTKFSKRLLLLSFRSLLMKKSLENDDTVKRSIVCDGAAWFQEFWQQHSLMGECDALLRAKEPDQVFLCVTLATLRARTRRVLSIAAGPAALMANRDEVKQAVISAIRLETFSDMVSAMCVDVDKEISDQYIFDCAWKASQMEDGFDDDVWIKAPAVVNDQSDLPFRRPSILEEERLGTLLRHPASRLDAVNLLLSFLEAQTHTISISKFHMESDTSKDSEINWSSMAESAYSKVEWAIRYLNSKAKRAEDLMNLYQKIALHSPR
ncbi:hypothetical protein HDU83_006441 [Entophlyctis luteolus]|nr:hypothetical protein HDU83_006441 [Entophlyctis luteolus]